MTLLWNLLLLVLREFCWAPAFMVWDKFCVDDICCLLLIMPFLAFKLSHLSAIPLFMTEKDEFKLFVGAAPVFLVVCSKPAVLCLLNLAIFDSNADFWLSERLRSLPAYPVTLSILSLYCLNLSAWLLSCGYYYYPRLSELFVDFQELPFLYYSNELRTFLAKKVYSFSSFS